MIGYDVQVHVKVKVRLATVADASACSEVLCASIRELCSSDHQDDEQVIADWVANKTPENLASWIQSPEAEIYVAEVEASVVGVGGTSGSEIALNYVAPNYKGCGVSTAILRALERILFDQGIRRAQLTSTTTAHEFYRQAGWTDSGEPLESLGVIGFPMEKVLGLGTRS